MENLILIINIVIALATYDYLKKTPIKDLYYNVRKSKFIWQIFYRKNIRLEHEIRQIHWEIRECYIGLPSHALDEKTYIKVEELKKKQNKLISELDKLPNPYLRN